MYSSPGGTLGIAVKIEDGSIEIVYAVVMEILEQLEIGTAEQRGKLDRFHHLERRNRMAPKSNARAGLWGNSLS